MRNVHKILAVKPKDIIRRQLDTDENVMEELNSCENEEWMHAAYDADQGGPFFKVVSPMHRPSLTPGNIAVRGRVEPRAIVRPERLSQ
jgi:hypothetical protein